MTPTMSVANPLKELGKFGQSVWFDYVRRSLMASGELKHLIESDGLGGVTSNPAIFEKSIAGSNEYADVLDELQKNKDLTPEGMYEQLAIRDIQAAADILRPVYDRTKKRDGYVSLEVSPYLAGETENTLAAARRLWKAVNRPNLMVKVPGTPAGIPAIKQLISEGININVTLLFSQANYEAVANAFISGLEAAKGDISGIASVASFFVSRIDSYIDSAIDKKIAAGDGDKAKLTWLKSKVAVANAKLAYQAYKGLFSGPRWDALKAKNAQTQRVLWASTSTKSPTLRDVIYIEELIGPDTVNTIPPATYDAFRDHGIPRASLEADLDEAHDVMNTLAEVGISMPAVTQTLQDQAVKLFVEAFDKLLLTVDAESKIALGKVNSFTYSVNADQEKAIQKSLEEWRLAGKVRRMWARDASIWTNDDEGKWLGWMHIAEDQLAHKEVFEAIQADVKAGGFTHVLLLGMGGSSLAPEVLKMSFGKIAGFHELHVLDSTDPAQIKTIEGKIDLKKTLFIVSSKSGSTLEPNIFKQYFFDKVGGDGSRFYTVTDPDSKVQHMAEHDKFRKIFHGVPSIGGRWSALSNFGMVPGAAMGVDVPKFLDEAETMAHACSSCVPIEKNPGVMLGTILGTMAKAGRDKVTIVASPGIHDLGAWLEQLLAESTGKVGKGLIPVDREALGAPDSYGHDRVFAYERLEGGADPAQDKAIDAIAAAGHPVVRIAVRDVYELGQEMVRWEVATAVAGSIIGINTFNQPDVEASKIETRKLTTEYEAKGSLPAETPALTDGGIKVYGKTSAKTLAEAVKEHINTLKAGDYFALLGYVEMNAAHEAALQGMREKVRAKKKVATCLGFGPRFLHSTGQAYKGGPNSGVFLQITCDDAHDLKVPGNKYTFSVVKAAQARGDLAVLVERGRRALRVHIGSDVKAGLATIAKAVDAALA
jgi:transaldolase/glucose-6-phosphate isomerase